MNCSLKCLTISRDIKRDDVLQILSCCSQLNRLEIKGNLVSVNLNDRIEYSFVQLKSLTIGCVCANLKEIESFLLLNPLLISLKLIGYISGSNGKRWEEFVQINLSHLNQFEFNIRYDKHITQTVTDIKEEIESYRSSFWIEHKKWFVGLDMFNEYTYQIYSISMFKPINKMKFDYENISIWINDDTLTVENFYPSMVQLNTCSDEYLFQSRRHCLEKIKKLRLYFDRDCPKNYLDHLRKIINLSELIELELICYSAQEEDEHSFWDLLKNFESFIVNY